MMFKWFFPEIANLHHQQRQMCLAGACEKSSCKVEEMKGLWLLFVLCSVLTKMPTVDMCPNGVTSAQPFTAAAGVLGQGHTLAAF